MSDDFQKLFKKQLQSAIITDESKKRMQRVQGEEDGSREDGSAMESPMDSPVDNAVSGAEKDTAETPAKPAARKKPRKKKKAAPAKSPKPASGKAAKGSATAGASKAKPAGKTPSREIAIDLDAPLPDGQVEAAAAPPASEKEPGSRQDIAIDLDSPLPDEAAAADKAPRSPEKEQPPKRDIAIDLDGPLPDDPEEAVEVAASSGPEKGPAGKGTIAADREGPHSEAMEQSVVAKPLQENSPVGADKEAATGDTDQALIKPVPQETAAAPTTAPPPGTPAMEKHAAGEEKATPPASKPAAKAATPAQTARDKGPDGVRELADEEGGEDLEHKYLTFHIGNETYGVEIGHVTEIIGMQAITEVPDMPDFIKGVINLRGEVIPVVEVRSRFGMEVREYDDRTCVVVVRLDDTVVGLVVDTVSEVLDIPEDHISPAPNVGNVAKSRFIRAMGRVDEEVRILLDLGKLLFDGYYQE